MSVESVALGDYLRARRNVTQPEESGLVRESGRRVPGLRRDEVAALANISLDYYLRLEQGRGTRPSDQVVHALARALNLDVESRVYLFRLVSGGHPRPEIPADESADRIARVLAQWTHTPAYVSDSNRDIVAANQLATIFGNGGLGSGHNVVIDLFNPRMKRTLAEWERMTLATVAGLRRDADPFSPRLKQIVDEMSGDPDFVRMWSRHDVSGPEDARVQMEIENIGTMEIDAQNLAVNSMPGYLLTVLFGPPQSLTASVFAQLAASLAASEPAPTDAEGE